MPSIAKPAVEGLATNYAAGEVVAAHRHDAHQVMHANHGIFRATSESASWVVPPGRALWMPAGREHTVRCYTAVQMRTVYLDRTFTIEAENCAVWSVSALMREVIVRFAEGPTPGTEEHLTALLISEIDVIDTLPLELRQPDDERLCVITNALNHDPADSRAFKNWAEKLGFSERSLIRKFQLETGMTFRHWRRQARMLMALERLANREPITRVALELGYETPSAFSAAFRETFGVTPRGYFSKD